MRGIRLIGIINVLINFLALGLSIILLFRFSLRQGPISLFNFFYIDSLSAFFIFTISTVTFASSLYSVSYINRGIKEETVSLKKAGFYYLCFNLFTSTMYFVTVVNNLGILWVAIEMTTLISAFLVGFYNTKESVEAAWKYIIICSVGIILALIGTILFSYALSLGGGLRSLNWTDMMSVSGQLDKNLLKIAFIFILVGYGTKAGLAPMHTWLPDAHSQAVAPISALLSGVLLKTAIYAILRFGIIMNRSLGESSHYVSNLLILLGLISLVVSCGFILVQKDIKRLLAYSSIEHVGIIALGFGIGGPFGIMGGLLHIFNHAVTKSLMFFSAGNIVSVYKKHNMRMIRGVLGSMPFTGAMALIGVFALAGMPPFSIFISEMMVIFSAFSKGAYLTAVLALFSIVIIFAGIIYHFTRMIFGKVPKQMKVFREPLSSKMAFTFLLFMICVFGLSMPWVFKNIINSVTLIMRGA